MSFYILKSMYDSLIINTTNQISFNVHDQTIIHPLNVKQIIAKFNFIGIKKTEGVLKFFFLKGRQIKFFKLLYIKKNSGQGGSRTTLALRQHCPWAECKWPIIFGFPQLMPWWGLHKRFSTLVVGVCKKPRNRKNHSNRCQNFDSVSMLDFFTLKLEKPIDFIYIQAQWYAPCGLAS